MKALLPWDVDEFDATIEDFTELAQWVRLEKRKMGEKDLVAWGQWHASTTHRRGKAHIRHETRPSKGSRAASSLPVNHKAMLGRLQRSQQSLDSNPNSIPLSGSPSKSPKKDSPQTQKKPNPSPTRGRRDSFLRRIDYDTKRSPS